MSFFQISFLTDLRVRITRWRTWALVLLLPLLIFFAARILPAEEVSTPVQVGVVLPETGGGDFWRRLEERSGLVVTFQEAACDQAERYVAAGRWDCALVLPEDFEERLAGRDLEGMFDLLIGPGSAVYPMVRETVAACLAECISPGMAEDYLVDSGIVEEGDLAWIRPRLEEVLLDQDRVLVSMETVDGAPLDPLALADSGVANLLAGLTAILILIWVLLTAMDLGRWLDSPAAQRLAPLRGRISLLLPRLAAALLPALCAGVLALTAAENPRAVGALVPYLLFWAAVALVLALRRTAWGVLPVLMPFVPVLGVLLSPVLLDLSTLFPALAPVIRWNPITLFLRACGGSWTDGLLLAAGGTAIVFLLLASDRAKSRSR